MLVPAACQVLPSASPKAFSFRALSHSIADLPPKQLHLDLACCAPALDS